MRINWGTGIVIAIVLFMSFILFFVIKVQSNSKYNNELVTEEYYKKEAFIEQDIQKQKNANKLEEKLIIQKTTEGISIEFPKSFLPEDVKGTVSLYRPSDQTLDFEIPISNSSPYLLIPKMSLTGGLWDITIDWSYKGTDYLNKETIYF